MNSDARRQPRPNRDQLLREVAQSLAADGVQVAGPERLSEFLRHYFKHADGSALLTRPAPIIARSLLHHAELAWRRLPGESHIGLYTPALEDDGWEAGGHTVLTVVTDDKDWLVDTVTMTVSRLGWAVRELLHPQFNVVRDAEGNLTDVVHRGQGDSSIAEAWLWIELYPPVGSSAADALPELADAINSSLADLGAAVGDHDAMQARLLSAAEEVEALGGEEAEITAQTLRWCADDRLLLLGARDFELADSRLAPLPEGLGILADDDRASASFGAVPADDQLLVITKDSVRSTVLRSSYLDYVAVHLRLPDGRRIERRFLGLFMTTALTEPVARIPVLRGKARQISAAIGYDRASYGGRSVSAAIEAYPRDDLFEASVTELAPIIAKIVEAEDPRRVITQLRPGRWGRFISVLVHMPRERYNTTVRQRIEQLLMSVTGAASSQWSVQVSDTPLASLHVTLKMPDGLPLPAVDEERLAMAVEEVSRSWDDRFLQIAERLDSSQRGVEYPDGYKEQYTPLEAIDDLVSLNQVGGPDDMVQVMYVPTPPENGVDFRVKMFRAGSEMVLSRILPHLSSLGVDVVDERPFDLELRGEQAHVYDFGLRLPGGAERLDGWSHADRGRFTAAVGASYAGLSEADRLNRLVTQTGLDWRQVGLLRAISRYLRQLGTTYSQPYIAETLNKHQQITTMLIELFEAKFSPWAAPDADREQRVNELSERAQEAIDAVQVLDEDRMLRQYLDVIGAMVRTNFFALDDPLGPPDAARGALAIKMEPRQLGFVRGPQPAHEIFVYSPQVEGVHVRYGKVARGGIRWSDRAEDYRTEVMDLAKAQTVKNAIIVPTGAKGGFYPRRLAGLEPAARIAEARASYARFIKALLSVTDNVAGGALQRPDRVVAWDDDDSYLVVAADKGTASFSDMANRISIGQGYWLGDAFASGGSTGYDHKKMGITARGAWISVERHLGELGINPASHDFSCVGIGDMSGDVFGNGMLRSEHIKLVAAFNHRHIFLDPDPDPGISFAERSRLFDAGRSWDAYRPDLISTGGGVYLRTAKSVRITGPAREVLGLDSSVTSLTPSELIRAILCAPVDLMWNGGIGTWVKATGQSHSAADDRTNDAVRVNAGQVRARCVGEGGNLGWTQAARVEYALAGGKINTDFIDNSAGVATSDHEVNIKILLDAAVRSGRLTTDERNILLQQMTDEVADIVLHQNVVQNRALANSLLEAPANAGVHDDLISAMVTQGRLNRAQDGLPSSEQLAARSATGHGLTDPELAMVLTTVKNALCDELLESDLPDDPYLADRLVKYFPAPLRERFADLMTEHPLARQIISTVAVNRFVDSQGMSAAHRLATETGTGSADIVRAQLVARNLMNAGGQETALAGSQVNPATQTLLRVRIRHLIERATRWILQTYRGGIDIEKIVAELKPGVNAVAAELPELITSAEHERYEASVHEMVGRGVDAELAEKLARWSLSAAALPIVRISRKYRRDEAECAQVYFQLSERLGIERALRRSLDLPRVGRWEIMARAAVRDELMSAQAALTGAALTFAGDTLNGADEIVSAWWQENPEAERQQAILDELASGPVDLARMSVAVASLRGLLDK
ncbi:NAD-glutamate dehydrogenase [Propionimicrobium sp. PCR01-08-3]|uniref:NAD-glutamate dehydrogenase n=1 Tax=Propionimicrobium sp. PCR01-08-3 TaxID=3052086 RepID=UPI00255C3100|nr:NAD-glutamate dehydrogenase [Propionimicrobium sp. PCR01-08-3]WIY83767.1 NAD-glutamate dehydrogenase [Propionimicrobium sp. PCR01-08-3]